jgi:hypothetical protein
VDCTNGPAGQDGPGSANASIPKPKDGFLDECPPVYYQTAFFRHLRYLWRARATFPLTDLLQHCDNIDAAFRRVLYHPTLAIVFASVFQAYLIIPVGQVFGSRSAPSFFSLLSDIRAYVATTRAAPLPSNIHPLVQQANFPDPRILGALAPAVADSYNPIFTAEALANCSNSTFVDDNRIANFADHIITSLHNSVVSAFDLFG